MTAPLLDVEPEHCRDGWSEDRYGEGYGGPTSCTDVDGGGECVHCECCCSCLGCEYGDRNSPPMNGPDPVVEQCYGLSSINPHALGSRVADCPECPDFDDYRKCTTCGAPTGEPCAAASGRVVGGQPDGIRTPLPRPHVARQRRAGR